MGEECNTYQIGNAYIIFARKSEGKNPFRRLRHRWEDIKLDLIEAECIVLYCIVFIMRSSNPYKVDTYRILNLSYTEIIQ
jgi:hypothetical protein